MDYEKKYNEALERAKELLLGNEHSNTIRSYFEHIFPQLRESEDERIRKWILEKVQGYADSGIPCSDEIQMANKALSWLEEQKDKNCLACDQHLKGYIAGRKVTEEEKQKEQKPELVQHPPITYTYPSDASRDERLKAALLALLNSDLLKVKEGGYFTKQDLIEWVERIPTDKPAWSEEDESFLDSIEDAISSYYDLNHAPQYHYWLEEKLKSLRPGWKPTEEQMEALAYAIQLLDDGLSPKAAKAGEELEHLREQLKKIVLQTK